MKKLTITSNKLLLLKAKPGVFFKIHAVNTVYYSFTKPEINIGITFWE